MNEFINLLAGFGLNFLSALIIVRWIYYRARQSKNFIFTFLAFNSVIFFVVTFLTSLEVSVGVGFGLFAIFSLLRYRTDPMPAREMTYLFIIIALPVMNSILISSGMWEEAALVNTSIIIVLFALEQGWGFHFEASKRVRYDRIDLIKPEHYALLLHDLKSRTGLPITRVEVRDINFLRDTADLKVYYTREDWVEAKENGLNHVQPPDIELRQSEQATMPNEETTS